jgi:hypothetical protein
MTLVVTLALSPIWQNLVQQQLLPVITELPAPATEATTAAVMLEQVVTAAELQALIAQGVTQPLVVCYNQPEYAIAQFLMAGASVEQALTNYQQELQQLLLLKRQHRRLVNLLNLQHLPVATASSEQELTAQHEPVAAAEQDNPLAALGLAHLTLPEPR